MNNSVFSVPALIFSLLLILPTTGWSHEGEHDSKDDHEKSSMSQKKFEEGSGSSALDYSREGEEHKGDLEGKWSKEYSGKEQHQKEYEAEEGSRSKSGVPQKTSPSPRRSEGSASR
ncbi:MAG: hypothetical protein ACE5E9_00545 [Nitrospinaceae bacterium]